ncbi:MAG: FG-GAP repeat domain-containing protein [Armatimonadota bacterium]
MRNPLICRNLLAIIITTGMAFATVQTQAAISLPTGQGPYQAAAYDLDGDGRKDLLVPCRGDLLMPEEKRPGNDILTVYLTAGKDLPDIRRDFKIGFGPYTAAVGDMDGDGIPDAAVANFQANDGRHLSMLWGAKDRSAVFEPDAPITIKGAPFHYEKNYTLDGRAMYPTPGLTSVDIADFNLDGKPDMVVAAYSSDFFTILLNKGKRKFSQRNYALLPGPRDIATADYDGDGKLDVAFTIYSCNMIQVFRGNGKGGFSEYQKFHTQGHIPYHLKASDLDHDGKTDIIAGNRGVSDDVVAFRNTGSGLVCIGQYTTDTVPMEESTTDEIRDVLLTDATGDGIPDLFAACRLSGKVIYWQGTGDMSYGKAFIRKSIRMFSGDWPRALVRLDDTMAVVCYNSSDVKLVPIAEWLTGVKSD